MLAQLLLPLSNAKSLPGPWHWGRSTVFSPEDGSSNPASLWGGAALDCGFINDPAAKYTYVGGSVNYYNDWLVPKCSKMPDWIRAWQGAGLYTAPQGDVYNNQTSTDVIESINHCYEVSWRTWPGKSGDPLPAAQPNVSMPIVTVRVLDSCPCQDNQAWCCGRKSTCGGGPEIDRMCGNNWPADAIHFDLRIAAFKHLHPDITKQPPWSVLGIVFREVECPAYSHNIWIWVNHQDWNGQKGYYLSFGVGGYNQGLKQVEYINPWGSWAPVHLMNYGDAQRQPQNFEINGEVPYPLTLRLTSVRGQVFVLKDILQGGAFAKCNGSGYDLDGACYVYTDAQFN